MNYQFDISNRRTVYNGFLKIDKAVVRYERYKDGQIIEAEREISNRGDSVAVLLFDTERKAFILTEQFRFPSAEKDSNENYPRAGWLIELAAGVMEEDELPEISAKREVIEELGYGLSSLEKISTFYASPGGSSERMHVFYAEVNAQLKVAEGGGLELEHEDIRQVYIPIDQVNAMISSGEIRDGKALVALYWWMLNKQTS
jgi:nudix-type nucleoside diphosphatase (YffH/AdpP family)